MRIFEVFYVLALLAILGVLIFMVYGMGRTVEEKDPHFGKRTEAVCLTSPKNHAPGPAART